MISIPPFSWHHLHPILVNYTAALIPTSIGCDVIRVIFRRPSLSAAAWWTMLLGVAITPLTATTGLFLMNATRVDDRSAVMVVHESLGLSLVVLLVPLCVSRGLIYRVGRSPGLIYFILAGMLMVALIYQGHLGGSMSFG